MYCHGEILAQLMEVIVSIAPTSKALRVVQVENEPECLSRVNHFLRDKGVVLHEVSRAEDIDRFRTAVATADGFRNWMRGHQSTLLVMDLGLTDNDKEPYWAAKRAAATENSKDPNYLEKINIHLNRISGIACLKSIKEHMSVSDDYRVIAICKHDDKLLIQRALTLGAFAYVTKYRAASVLLESLAEKGDHEEICRTPGVFQPIALGQELYETLSRASMDLALSAVRSQLPSEIVAWSQINGRDPWVIDGVNGTLFRLDVRGSTGLLELAGPRGGGKLFRSLINLVFEDLVQIVIRHGGDVSAFTCDGFLAFFNIYGKHETANLDGAAAAAVECAKLFESVSKRKVLEKIAEMIPVQLERPPIEEYVARDFGLRIGIARTDHRHSVVATLGGKGREQHTIVSEQMNALRRGLDCTGAEERKQGGKQEPLPSTPIVLITQDIKRDRHQLAPRYLISRPLKCSFRGLERRGYDLMLLTEATATEQTPGKSEPQAQAAPNS